MAKKKTKKKAARKQHTRVAKREEQPAIYPDVPQIIDNSQISFFLSREGLGDADIEDPKLFYQGDELDLPNFVIHEGATDVIHFFTRRKTKLPDEVSRSIDLFGSGSLRITIRPSGSATRKEEYCFDVLLLQGPH